jgi:signal transduction histidine kinase
MNDNLILPVFIFSSMLFVLFASFIIIYLIIQKRNQFKHQTEKEQMALQYKNELLNTQLEVQEAAFKSISQEIHDNIGQILSLVKLNLYTAAATEDHDINVIKIEESKELIGKAITDLRLMSHTLSGQKILQEGLVDASRKELKRTERSYNIQTKFECNVPSVSISGDRELFLFRIIQEALQNILKHASAKKITLQFFQSADHLSIELKDDGIGFDPTRGGGGIGLLNMKERAKMINADFTIESEPGQGTIITINIKNL